MGYTHYFSTQKETGAATWAVLVEQAKQLAAAIPEDIKICGGFGTGAPEFTDERLWFNGDEATGQDYETMMVERVITPAAWSQPDEKGLVFNFCKTAQRPYDLLVCAVLIAMKQTIICSIGTDGDEADWKDAIAFYNRVMGRKVTFKNLFK